MSGGAFEASLFGSLVFNSLRASYTNATILDLSFNLLQLNIHGKGRPGLSCPWGFLPAPEEVVLVSFVLLFGGAPREPCLL